MTPRTRSHDCARKSQNYEKLSARNSNSQRPTCQLCAITSSSSPTAPGSQKGFFLKPLCEKSTATAKTPGRNSAATSSSLHASRKRRPAESEMAPSNGNARKNSLRKLQMCSGKFYSMKKHHRSTASTPAKHSMRSQPTDQKPRQSRIDSSSEST